MKIELVMDGVANNQKLNPGGFVPLNADNDNGSVVTNRIPAVRDFAVHPIPDEDDLVKVAIYANAAPSSGIFALRVSNHGKARIRLWDTATKQNKIIPGHFRHLPTQIYVEGVQEGAAEREIDLTVEYKENHNLIRGEYDYG